LTFDLVTLTRFTLFPSSHLAKPMADADGLLRLLSDHTHALASLHAQLGSPPETLQAQLASLQKSLVAAIDDQRRALEQDVARIRASIAALRNEVAQMQKALGEPEPDTDQLEGESLTEWKERVQRVRKSVGKAHEKRSRELRATIDRLRGLVDLLGSDWHGLQGLPREGDEDKDLRVQKLEEWQGVAVACEHEIVGSTRRLASFCALPTLPKQKRRQTTLLADLTEILQLWSELGISPSSSSTSTSTSFDSLVLLALAADPKDRQEMPPTSENLKRAAAKRAWVRAGFICVGYSETDETPARRAARNRKGPSRTNDPEPLRRSLHPLVQAGCLGRGGGRFC
jgi:hypothetical protein